MDHELSPKGWLLGCPDSSNAPMCLDWPECHEEIAESIGYMRKRLESGQGALASAMCRLSLPMSEKLLRLVGELEKAVRVSVQANGGRGDYAEYQIAAARARAAIAHHDVVHFDGGGKVY